MTFFKAYEDKRVANLLKVKHERLIAGHVAKVKVKNGYEETFSPIHINKVSRICVGRRLSQVFSLAEGA